MASLREVQESFAAALRDPHRPCAVRPPANLGVYRNNSHFVWRATLERVYPVVRRRVGEDFFRQLCAAYRERVPSRSGDLHDYGREFPGFLESYLEQDYVWLADLARLEWSRAECAVAAELPAITVDALARYRAEQLEHLVFGLQPSLRLHASSYPVLSVWEANQDETATPVDQSLGREQFLVLIRDDVVHIHRLEPALHSYISALAAGSPLGEAMTRAGFDDRALTDALAFLFRAELVCSLTAIERS